MNITRFLASLASLAASVTLGANLISSGSAQAAIFDFDAVWTDNTTTKGWVEVDDTPENQESLSGYYDEQGWLFASVLDADFTHEGTRYGKSDLTYLSLNNINWGSNNQSLYGTFTNFLNLEFNNQYVNLADYSVDGSPHTNRDSGYKRTNGSYATSLSVVERPAKAVPEPTTMAGVALVGLGIAATRRKQTKASVKV